MTDFKKIFLDTAPIVYYLESNRLYYSKMKRFWIKYENCDYVYSQPINRAGYYFGVNKKKKRKKIIFNPAKPFLG